MMFTQDTFQFFQDVQANNSRDWWLANKSRYEAVVKQPIIDLTNHLSLIYSEAHIFRPNRDTRFTKDKSPYKSNISFSMADGKGSFYLQLDGSGILLGGGIYEPNNQQLRDWRTIFDSDHKTIVKDFLYEGLQKGYEIMQENALKTVPRGWPKDHPEVEHLRLKHATIFKKFTKDDWMMTPAAFDVILDGFDFVHEWNAILNRLIISE